MKNINKFKEILASMESYERLIFVAILIMFIGSMLLILFASYMFIFHGEEIDNGIRKIWEFTHK